MTPVDLAPNISGALEAREAEGRTRVLRALLVRPVLRAQTDGELFRLARRHADALRAWFDRETGWRLVVESQTVRLQTSYVPHGPTATAVAGRHPARGRKGEPPFTRRRYVLLCLALAVLERSDPQISLGRLAEDIVLAARQPGPEGVVFTLSGRDERSDLVAAIRLLLGYGVLVRVAGDEESYVSAGGDALYDVDRRVLATMLSTGHGPGLVDARLGPDPAIDQIEAALHEPPPVYTEEESTRRLRHAVTRRLLCDPVVYYDELPEDERSYLVGQRVQLTRRLAEATGLVPELRAEGIALVDPDDVASTALCLGVPGVSAAGTEGGGHTYRTATATSLEAMRAARMPVVLTLDQVRSGGVRALPRGSVIHVCENPTVVEVVAARWARTTAGTSGRSGAVGPVLVCTSGQPSTAVVDLLSRLAGEGAQCRYHGDFDWAGLRIAWSLGAQVPWVPWRYTAADYRAAVQGERPSRDLTGSPAQSPWDPELAVAMAECGLALEEEAVADLLAADLLAGWP